MEEEAANIDLKIPKEVFEFLFQMAMRIEIADGGGIYLHLPYWIEIRNKEEFLVRFHNLESLPEELRNALRELINLNIQGTGIESAGPKDGLEQYCQHLPTCNIMQDWSEAEQALSDTPMRFRDEGWEKAVEEMYRKKQTCTCGLNKKLYPESGDEVITNVEFEDDEDTRESSTDTAGEPSGEK